MGMSDRITKKYKSATHYMLASLIPYSESNIKLVFTPKHFFKDLAQIDRYKEQTLKNAYYHSIKKGYIEISDKSGAPIITEEGLNKLKPYLSKKLSSSQLMVIFDIPENHRYKRYQLRATLRQLEFSQVQKSVWVTDLDSREYLGSEIKRLNLGEFVEIFECRKLKK